MKIRTYYLAIRTDNPGGVSPNSLRGFIGTRFSDLFLLHNHMENGSLIYTFPRVQYQIINGTLLITGIDEGVDSVMHIEPSIEYLDLNGFKHRIIEKKGIEIKSDFGVSKKTLHYTFLSPWLALNEKNYEKYQLLVVWKQKKALLEKILVGNILSMSKSLGYTVPAPIEANIINMKEVPTALKGTPMLGFLGTFSVNFEIPNYWGIGKSVSRGFGTVKRGGVIKRGNLM